MKAKEIGQAVARWWDSVWFQRFDPLAVGVFRISLGALLIVYFVALYPNWMEFFAADGMISLHDSVPQRPPPDVWTVFYWADGWISVQVWWWIGMTAVLGFTLGWQTRFWTICLFILESSMIYRNPAVVNGEDLVFRVLLFYSCFAPLGASLSVDRWLLSRQSETATPRELPMIWAVRLIQVNIALVYLISMPYKLTDESGEWARGDAMYWAMMNDTWAGRLPHHWFYGHRGVFLSVLMTYGTIVIELAFPLLVWFRKTRLLVLAGITSLHLGIAVIIPNVAFFTLSMVCSFWLFVPADDLRRWGNGLARAIRRRWDRSDPTKKAKSPLP